MLTLVLCAALAQNPAPQKTAIVQGSNFGVPPRRLAELMRGLREVLKAGGFETVDAKNTCESKDCVLASGKLLGAETVLSPAFAQVGKETTVDLEALLISDGHSLAAATLSLAPGKSVTAADLEPFLTQLKEGLKPKEVAPPPDAPKQVQLVPADPPPRPPPAYVEQRSTPTAPLILGAGALVIGAAAGALAIVAGVEANAVNRNTIANAKGRDAGISLTEAADRLKPANTLYTASLISACLAGVLAVIAVVLFAAN